MILLPCSRRLPLINHFIAYLQLPVLNIYLIGWPIKYTTLTTEKPAVNPLTAGLSFHHLYTCSEPSSTEDITCWSLPYEKSVLIFI